MRDTKALGLILLAGGAFIGFREISRLADINILARTIWGEARGQPDRGMIAVANVVMNRVADRRWPNSARGVCLQPWQFSAWNENDPNRPKMLAVTEDDPTFRRCVEIATAAIDATLPDVTGGADHYFTKEIDPPAWSADMTELATIGDHRFFVS